MKSVRHRAERGHVAGAHLQHADLIAAAAAEQPAAGDDRHDAAVLEADPPAEENHRDLGIVAGAAALRSEAEELLPFQEELALLGKLQREPRQVELLLVVFDLREVRVLGEVGDVALRDRPLDVHADVAVATFAIGGVAVRLVSVEPSA